MFVPPVRCGYCDSYNTGERTACRSCGAPLLRPGDDPGPPPPDAPRAAPLTFRLRELLADSNVIFGSLFGGFGLFVIILLGLFFGLFDPDGLDGKFLVVGGFTSIFVPVGAFVALLGLRRVFGRLRAHRKGRHVEGRITEVSHRGASVERRGGKPWVVHYAYEDDETTREGYEETWDPRAVLQRPDDPVHVLHLPGTEHSCLYPTIGTRATWGSGADAVVPPIERTCASCGQEAVSVTDTHCRSCGDPLPEPAPADPGPKPPEAPREVGKSLARVTWVDLREGAITLVFALFPLLMVVPAVLTLAEDGPAQQKQLAAFALFATIPFLVAGVFLFRSALGRAIRFFRLRSAYKHGRPVIGQVAGRTGREGISYVYRIEGEEFQGSGPVSEPGSRRLGDGLYVLVSPDNLERSAPWGPGPERPDT